MLAQRQAERQFPVRVRIAVPPEGLGRQLEIIHAWLDETCGAEGWAVAPAGLPGVVNDALAFYFADAAFAHAFVARFCCGYPGRHHRGRIRLPKRDAAAEARRPRPYDSLTRRGR